MGKYLLYFNTLKYMKLTQIRYRLYYVLRSKYRKIRKFSYSLSRNSQTVSLSLYDSIQSYESYQDDKFTFLNISEKLGSEIDWNYIKHGKLWAYNLNYFEYLNQEEFNKSVGLKLIDDFIDNVDKNKQGLEPFPISLRGINWIKFLSKHKIKEKKIDDSLYAQYYILLDNLEYHILGNHLLENGFSLLFGAYYFQDDALYKKAIDILISELNEEILQDGAHYELSPMYHQLMLFRLLDCINLVQNSNRFSDLALNNLFVSKASFMLSWLKQMSYKDRSIPHFNDSSDGIAPTTDMLFDYAKRLGLKVESFLPLQDSGYRAIEGDNYELRVDVGNIGPSYIPGHAHSDTFNFELRVDGKPFIVDTGISTYENNSQRLFERGTSAHNTVKVDNIEQSKVWSSFRVANRAKVIYLKEEQNYISAWHDGYKNLGIIHQRDFIVDKKSIKIKDNLGKNRNDYLYHTYIHFHPDIKDIRVEEDKVLIKGVILSIKGSKNLQLDDFTFANGFNKLENAKVLKITFESELYTEIIIL